MKEKYTYVNFVKIRIKLILILFIYDQQDVLTTS